MKKLLLIISLIAASISGMGSTSTIERLWKDYESALKADKPQRQMEILSQIKDISRKERLPWDFYSAGTKYVSAASSRNWKMRDSLERQLRREVLDFDEPIMTFYAALDTPEEKYDYILSRRKAMEKSHNGQFYSADWLLTSHEFSPVLMDIIENDWQCALWSLTMGNSHVPEYRSLLEQTLAGAYPQADFLEFWRISNIFDDFSRKSEYLTFAQSRPGKATALLAEEELLQMEYYSLENSKAGEDQYKALRQKCVDFQKKCKGFKGSEAEIAECCTMADGLIEILDSKYMDVSIEKGVLTARLRNLDGLEMTVSKDKKECFKTSIKNPRLSYYVEDTLTFALPDMEDGVYQVKCTSGSDHSTSLSYNKYSLSIATRRDALGAWVLVTDALTGEPVPSADLTLKNNDGRTLAEAKDFALDGFTMLPQAFASKLDGSSRVMRLVASRTDAAGFLRSSRETYPSSVGKVQGKDEQYALIYTDRRAFNPEETVQYMVLVYDIDQDGNRHVAHAGTSVTVRLVDPTGMDVGEQKLSTNEFGSASGSFVIPRSQRNGRFYIEAGGQGFSTSQSLRVDDFVLPTFDLTFDADTKLYHAGDEIEVSGVIRSYSGHSLSAAKVTLQVTDGGETLKEEPLLLGEGGRFKTTFVCDGPGYHWCRITVRATDSTGETLEWSTQRTVYDGIPFSVQILDQANGSWRKKDQYGYYGSSSDIISSDTLKVQYSCAGMVRDGLKVDYQVIKRGKTVREGEIKTIGTTYIDLSDLGDGLYTIKSVAHDRDVYGHERSSQSEYQFVKLSDGATTFDGDVMHVFKVIPGDDMALQVCTTGAPMWAFVDVHGEDGVLLGSFKLHLETSASQSGPVRTVRLPLKGVDDARVQVSVRYFRDYALQSWSYTMDRSDKVGALPLRFTRFFDRTSPRGTYRLLLETEPDVECAATVFDKSTETMQPNQWLTRLMSARKAVGVSYDGTAGIDRGDQIRVRGYASAAGSVKNGAVMMSKAAPAPDVMYGAVKEEMADVDDALAFDESMETEEAIPFQLVDEVGPHAMVRENFANTLAFEPELRSDAAGHVEFEFAAADKLSTYIVQVLAHTKDMRMAVQRRETVVTIPVKVALVEPQQLYDGDRYVLGASLASNSEQPVEGTLRVDFYDGAEYKGMAPMLTLSKDVTVPAGGAISESFTLDEVPPISCLGIKLSFAAADGALGGDALFVSVPVLRSVQTLTETHSSILHKGESMESLLAQLRGEFVNVPGFEAIVREISLLQMVRDAIPTRVDVRSDNALALSEALYVRALAQRLGVSAVSQTSSDALMAKLLECRRADGGWSWFSTMESSPIVTAVLLQRYASARDRGISIPLIDAETVEKAVKFLDSAYFGRLAGRPAWCGGLSMEQYLSIRAMFPEVRFDAGAFDREVIKKFARSARMYLVPAKERGLNGQILAKARRMRVLMSLSGSDDGRSLARAWGIKLLTGKRLQASLVRDLSSLVEYAIQHRCGGWYYPNAVLPWRGLLESEAYAHSFIADLLRDVCSEASAPEELLSQAGSIAEGIRLWLMVQKETQQWGDDAAFVEALASVLDATPETLDTRVVVLSASFEKPFAEVLASGNGFSIERSFYLERSGSERVELHEGDTLHVGDKVTAEYRIWNEENRSFVLISAPRPSSLRPVDQLSGAYGWWLRPLSVPGYIAVTPHGYRSVLADRTEYWFDTYPEEHTVVSEDMFVTQEGAFQIPAPTVESLYAPHYRANAAGRGAMVSAK